MVAPVENSVTAPRLRVFPRRSLSPGSIVIVYAVLFFQPRFGRTAISSRCQSTLGSPSEGEMRNSAVERRRTRRSLVDDFIESENHFLGFVPTFRCPARSSRSAGPAYPPGRRAERRTMRTRRERRRPPVVRACVMIRKVKRLFRRAAPCAQSIRPAWLALLPRLSRARDR